MVDRGERRWDKPVLIPNAVETRNGILEKINSFGIRGKEIELHKEKGAVRIAMFGDSFTY